MVTFESLKMLFNAALTCIKVLGNALDTCIKIILKPIPTWESCKCNC